jgi:capsid portal protein
MKTKFKFTRRGRPVKLRSGAYAGSFANGLGRSGGLDVTVKEIGNKKIILTTEGKPKFDPKEMGLSYPFLRAGEKDRSSQLLHSDVEWDYESGDIVAPPYELEDLADLLETNAIHWACVRAKVSTIVGLGWDIRDVREANGLDKELKDLKKIKSKGINEVKRIRDLEEALFHHEEGGVRLSILVNNPNESDTIEEIFDNVLTDQESLGNGYLEIVRDFDSGYPCAWYHAPGMTMRVRKDMRGFCQIVAGKKTWFKNYGDLDVYDKTTGKLRGKVISEDVSPRDVYIGNADIQWYDESGEKTGTPLKEELWASEIQQHKVYHPKSSYYGFSDILPALGAAAGLTASSNFNLDFFFHGAVMTVAVLIEGFKAGPNSKVVRSVRKFFEEDILQNPHAALVLAVPPPIVDPISNQPVDRPRIEIKELQHPIRDGGWTNYRKGCRDEILAAHRVPPHLISSIETGNIGTGQGRSQMENFRQQVSGPRKHRFEVRINKIVSEFGAWWLSLREVRTISPVEGANIAAIMSKGSLGSADEIRDYCFGLPPMKGGMGARVWLFNPKTGDVMYVDEISGGTARKLVGATPAKAARIIADGMSGKGAGNRKLGKYVANVMRNGRSIIRMKLPKVA